VITRGGKINIHQARGRWEPRGLAALFSDLPEKADGAVALCAERQAGFRRRSRQISTQVLKFFVIHLSLQFDYIQLDSISIHIVDLFYKYK